MPSTKIDVTTPDGVADCHLSIPDGVTRPPGVLFMIDAIGLRARTEEMADRIAAEGYAVLAPNIFYRGGRAPIWETPNLADQDERDAFMGRLRPLAGELTAEAMGRDGGAYLDALAEHSSGPAGITGYCMGGRHGWSIAAAHPERVAALGGFHTGGMVSDGPDSPHRLAPAVTAEVYWGFADEDGSMTPDNVAELDRAMDGAGITHTTEVYAGAAHGYTMSDQGAWNAEACARHYENLFALLARTIGD